jgi:hypothetical protein
MKTLLKIILYPIIAFFALGFIGAIFSGVSEVSDEMDKIEKTAGMEFVKSYPTYWGMCNEVYKGDNEVYYSPEEDVYYLLNFEGKISPYWTKKEWMEEDTAHWTKENLAKERAQSKLCVEYGKQRYEKLKKKRELKKKTEELIEELLEELN